jgi:hypothetical protein
MSEVNISTRMIAFVIMSMGVIVSDNLNMSQKLFLIGVSLLIISLVNDMFGGEKSEK